jgi:peptidoglycan/xylan/chitin deacetylase (PgdA/CDA1 family)/predicted phosphodiesterase
MHLALLADVHGNLEALDAVLRDIEQRAPGARLVCAGDVVGYGPDPEACIERLRAYGAVIVKGNHEEMVLGSRDLKRCVYAGIRAVVWTRFRLSPRTRAFLANLPGWVEATPGVIVCHGDLASADTYVSSDDTAARALERLRELCPAARVLVTGHTHHPTFYSRERGFVRAASGQVIDLPDRGRCLVNPGSTGQSRDGHVLARYAVLDMERGVVSYSALSYDYETTLEKLRRAGLVARVVQMRPVGARRKIERLKTRWARFWGVRAMRRALALDQDTFLAGTIRRAMPSTVRRGLLNVGQGFLHASGAGAAFVRAQGTQGALILMYHGISEGEVSPWIDPRYSVPKAVFERQMAFLFQHRHVLPLSELLRRLDRSDPIAPGSVVITFDDGYRSTLEIAAPVLRHFGLPAIAYLPTSYITHRKAQFIDELYAAFRFRTRSALRLDGHEYLAVELDDPMKARRTYLELELLLSRSSRDTREQLLVEIVEQLEPECRPPRLTLDWQEVAHLRRTTPTLEIGAHTRDHVDLATCDFETALEQTAGSVRDVRDELGIVPEHFSFPFGRANDRARSAVARAGLKSAAMTEPAALVRAETHRLALPRLSAPRDMSLFAYYTSGAYPDLSLTVLGRT